MQENRRLHHDRTVVGAQKCSVNSLIGAFSLPKASQCFGLLFINNWKAFIKSQKTRGVHPYGNIITMNFLKAKRKPAFILRDWIFSFNNFVVISTKTHQTVLVKLLRAQPLGGHFFTSLYCGIIKWISLILEEVTKAFHRSNASLIMYP